MKAAGITPIFKKEDSLNKENYRPVIELPTISKLSERVLFNQNFQISFFLQFCVVLEKGIAFERHS